MCLYSNYKIGKQIVDYEPPGRKLTCHVKTKEMVTPNPWETLNYEDEMMCGNLMNKLLMKTAMNEIILLIQTRLF